MIPLLLRLSGFLSYRDPVELDFNGFELACISGPNGAGKSSLLDAITWSLFGQARKRDDSLINLHPEVKAAEVDFTFSYEGYVYRLQRRLPRGKTMMLEFQLQAADGGWRSLTEHTLRETQARIEETLRLDYDTFVNAAFFLQGKADQFTQQTPTKRKEVLSNILGLEIWEAYRERTAESRRALESELEGDAARLAEIDAELSEEPMRKANLVQLEAKLGQLATERKAQETALEHLRKVAASLEEQRRLVQTLDTTLGRSRANLVGLQARLAEREAERTAYAELLARADGVEKAYHSWQQARIDLGRWDEIAAQFHQQEKFRQPLLEAISSKRARLQQERETLKERQKEIAQQTSVTGELQSQLEIEREALKEADAKVAQCAELQKQVQSSREQQAALLAENTALKAEMEVLIGRIEGLKAAEGAACPLCGQPLSEEHRASTLAQLETEGKLKGDSYRTNQAELTQLGGQIKSDELRAAKLALADKDHLEASNSVTKLTERLETLQNAAVEWQAKGERRLMDVTGSLEREAFAEDLRRKLAEVDNELAALGYDAVTHDAVRKVEAEGRNADRDYRKLESARAALTPLEREINDLGIQIANLEEELAHQQAQYDEAAAALAAAESQMPNVESVERQMLNLQEQENQLNQEVGAARQKVNVLDGLRARKAGLESRRQELARQIGRHKILERAFGKDGVPALLIEQALPQIESKANDLLERLSGGSMSVSFTTQAEYKDRKREDKRETLDISIRDGAGKRDYEMYSGGEAFRVDFAIRLALSEVLAQRRGARLRTLVIDEGFGSQDAQGRQRLIEAINQVRGDFAKILIITHLEELQDAFPTRIEVEKTERGSILKII
jgi:exonuclease SbcC